MSNNHLNFSSPQLRTKPILDPVYPASEPKFPEFLPSFETPKSLPTPTQEQSTKSPLTKTLRTNGAPPPLHPHSIPLREVDPSSITPDYLTCPKCDELTKRVKNLERTIQELERPISVNGTFIWNISDVSKKQSYFRDGYIESPVFYTGMFGYKLQGCVYLNGDGEAARKSISVYIILLKGDYDNLIAWPFLLSVSIILIDQSQNGLDVVKTFQPTRSSSCFKQPLDNIKRPTGLPDFIPLSSLKEPYLVDDIMFLKFVVHPSSD